MNDIVAVKETSFRDTVQVTDEALAQVLLELDASELGICSWRALARCLMCLDLPVPSEQMLHRFAEFSNAARQMGAIDEAELMDAILLRLPDAMPIAASEPSALEPAAAA